MSDAIVIRVMSNAGRSRVEISAAASLKELKTQVSERLGLDAATLKMYTDQAMKKPVAGRDTDTLAKCGLKNGDMLHVNNEGATMTHIKTGPKFKSHDEIKQEKEEKAKNAPLVDSSGRVIKAVDKKDEQEEGSKDYYGKTLKPVVKEEKKEVKMINDKKLGDDAGEQFVKH